MNEPAASINEWVLTKEIFDRLLSRFAPEREIAAEQYEITRRKLIKFFTFHRADDPEAATDEVINRVARRLDSGEQIENLHGYFLGVARFLLKETAKKNVRRDAALKEVSIGGVAAAQLPTEAEQRERLHVCFENCLQKLPEDERGLIVKYYRENKSAKIEHRKELSEEMGIAVNALRIRMHRIRARLERCISECVEKS